MGWTQVGGRVDYSGERESCLGLDEDAARLIRGERGLTPPSAVGTLNLHSVFIWLTFLAWSASRWLWISHQPFICAVRVNSGKTGQPFSL